MVKNVSLAMRISGFHYVPTDVPDSSVWSLAGKSFKMAIASASLDSWTSSLTGRWILPETTSCRERPSAPTHRHLGER